MPVTRLDDRNGSRTTTVELPAPSSKLIGTNDTRGVLGSTRGCGTVRPQVSFSRRNYGEIPVTVLRPVHVGDSMTSVLLNGARGCGWRVARLCGLCVVVGDQPRFVHATVSPGKSACRFAHRHIHSRRCDWWVGSAGSFWRLVVGRRSALRPLPNPGGEFLDMIEDFAPFGHLGENFALGIHDRGVVAAECLPDLRQ